MSRFPHPATSPPTGPPRSRPSPRSPSPRAPRGPRRSLETLLPAVLLVIALQACSRSDAPRPDPGEADAPPASADVTEVVDSPVTLPDGAEAVSLLGEPLYAPPLSDEVRTELETDLESARADLAATTDDPTTLIWVGRRLAYLGRYRDAIEVYTRGIEQHPDEPRLYRHRGHRWITVREFDRAVEDLQRAAEMVAGTDDRVEPDGQPNEQGVPVSTLHFNVWYHLGLAHYLRGELEKALLAWQECRRVSKHPDTVVSTSYWLVNTMLRLGLEEPAREVLAGVEPRMGVIESTAYMNVLLLHKGVKSEDDLLGAGSEEHALENVTTAYGVGNWHVVNGRREEGFRIWERIVETSDRWAAFGYIAAEADLHRIR